jgi:hypothetical protein
MSASSLIGKSSMVVENVKSKNGLYNPSIPIIADKNIKELRNIKFKDRYYLDQRIDGQMKNTEGTIGPNNKFLTRIDYDRQIDENYLRRQNPKNRKHTDPADFYNGSQLSYYGLPVKIPRAIIQQQTIDPMEQYQYQNRFISNPLLPATRPSPTPEPFPQKPSDMMDNIGFDPVDIQKQLEIDKLNSIGYINQNSGIVFDKGKNQYNEPIIRTGPKFYPK